MVLNKKKKKGKRYFHNINYIIFLIFTDDNMIDNIMDTLLVVIRSYNRFML